MEPDRHYRGVNKPDSHSGANYKSVGIYVHVPFCEKKCFYCDFYSIENHSQRKEFLSSLISEIELLSQDQSQQFAADTIFFGGGTPSLLSATEITSILDTLAGHFDLSHVVEITVECNPGTITLESLTSYHNLGINRLSFGVQSFFDDELKFLSRIHDSQQAIDAIHLARKCGFENINLDLMYGLPGQTMERVEANLRTAVHLEPDHISAYNLIVEPGTPLFSSVAAGAVKVLEEKTEATMYELTMALLEQDGFEHYEISNYSRRGYNCRHNLKYWNSEEYLGFGPSAHSYLAGWRWWNVSSLGNYIAELSSGKLPISAREQLTENQVIDEFIMLQLRQGKIDLKKLDEGFQLTLDPDFILDLVETGYAEAIGNRVFLTRKGFLVCDEIIERVGRHLISPFENARPQI